MRGRTPDVSLILACYNEELVFEESVERILQTLEASRFSFEIIFVDDKSADATASLIQKACKKYPQCRAMFHNVNCGRGKTVRDGIVAARGKVVGYIDIDLEVSPVYIPEMTDLILSGEAEVALGRRIYRTRLGSFFREVTSRGYQWLAEAMVGTGGLDTETGYKFFNRKKILPILKKARHPGWFWDTEVMVLAKRAGLKILEVPVLFLRRTDKKSTVRVFRDIIDYLVSLWKFRKRLGYP